MKSYFKFSNSLDSSLFEQWPNKHKISLFGLKTNEKEATFIFSVLKLVQKSTLHLLSCTATLPFSSYSFILMQMSKASICFYFSISHKTDYINFQLQPWQALQQQQKKWVCLPTTHDKEQMKYVSSSKALACLFSLITLQFLREELLFLLYIISPDVSSQTHSSCEQSRALGIFAGLQHP